MSYPEQFRLSRLLLFQTRCKVTYVNERKTHNTSYRLPRDFKMPESYVDLMTDLPHACFKCNTTVTGEKKKLSKCAGCHAISYCGRECQRADWPRHKWNCLPVMVKEIPGKGRGLVAARDIKMGELIFADKPAIKLSLGATVFPGGPDLMKALKVQIENLPTEAKLQFIKLNAPMDDQDMNDFSLNLAGGNEDDAKLLRLFFNNSLSDRNKEFASLYLNHALVNHSCAPNAASGKGAIEGRHDLRAIKDISKGEEVATCYVGKLWDFGCNAQERRMNLEKKVLSFVCNCPVCLGKVSSQEEIGTKLMELHEQLSDDHYQKDLSDWRNEVETLDKIVDLTLQLHIGKVEDKFQALNLLTRRAQLARDGDRLKEAMKTWKQMAEDFKLVDLLRGYKIMEECLTVVSGELKSNSPPTDTEIDFIFSININV